MTDKNLQRVVTKAVAEVKRGKPVKLHVAISGVGWVSGYVAAPPADRPKIRPCVGVGAAAIW